MTSVELQNILEVGNLYCSTKRPLALWLALSTSLSIILFLVKTQETLGHPIAIVLIETGDQSRE